MLVMPACCFVFCVKVLVKITQPYQENCSETGPKLDTNALYLSANLPFALHYRGSSVYGVDERKEVKQ